MIRAHADEGSEPSASSAEPSSTNPDTNRIFLVEDDEDLRANYVELLNQKLFHVTAVSNKIDAIRILSSHVFDVIVLDVQLGNDREAGFEICQHIRSTDKLRPIIFLTNHTTDTDRISGLRTGADDYLSKTESIEYLAVRINTLIRRFKAISSPDNDTHSISKARHKDLNIEHLTLDERSCRVKWKGMKVHLALTQYWIVYDLALNLGKVRSHEELMEAAQIFVEPNTVVRHIMQIRNAFRSVDPSFSSIQTERAAGYRWLD